MTQDEKISYDEPKIFTIAKFRLYYSVIALIVIVGISIFDKAFTSPVCFAGLALFVIYLFFPFTYKLIVSDEAISSINLLGTRTLEWKEVAEIGNRKNNLLLINQGGDIKVAVNQQIDGYPEVIKFIKQQRPELWQLEDTKAFHQNIFEATLLGAMGLLIIFGTIMFSLEDGFSFSQDLPTILFGLFIGFVLLWQSIKIREIIFDADYIVTKYIVGERRVHINEIQSVSLEQRLGKNEISYPVYIKLRDGKQVVIEKAKEGNPVLINAIETWMDKYKGKQND